ncbi:MAG: Fic family protein [Bdellovibrionales bacterium]|nr:Fic family protein [Bdellovibrionales bacterium]
MTSVQRFTCVVLVLLFSTQPFSVANATEGYSSEGFKPSPHKQNGGVNSSEGQKNECAATLQGETRLGKTYEELLAAYLTPDPNHAMYSSNYYANEGGYYYNEGGAPGEGAYGSEGALAASEITDPDQVEIGWLEQMSKRFLRNFYWNTAADRGVFYDALLSKRRRLLADKTGIHPSEAFGLATMRDFKRMYRYFDEIPNTDFQLTPEVIQKGHEIGNQSQKVFQQVFSSGPLSFLAGYLFKPGKYKKRRNQLSLMVGVSPQQLENLNGKLDELIDLGILKHVTPDNRADYELRPLRIGGKTIREVKLDTDGMYKGWLMYPAPRIVEQAMEDITAWANEQMAAYNAKEPGAKDPVFIAVAVKQALYYIHPFVDGNGRTGRAVRDKILEVYGLLPVLRLQHYHDIDLTIQQDYNLAKMGLVRRIQQLERTGFHDAPKSAANVLHLDVAGEGAFTTNLGYLQPVQGTSPSNTYQQVFNVGNVRSKQMIFTNSGFFQDYTGVNYSVVPGSLEHGSPRLVPVPDANLLLYSFGGDVERHEKLWMRKENPYHWEILRANLNLAQRLVHGQLAGSDVTLESYHSIKSANDNGAPQFQDWEMSMVAYSLTIKEDPEADPQSVISPLRGAAKAEGQVAYGNALTTYESLLANGAEALEYDAIFGQAQRLDIFYRKMNQHIKANNRSWHSYISPKIEASRRKVHRAVRVMLEPVFPLLEALFESDFENQDLIEDKRAWSYLRQDVPLTGLYHQMRFTPFWYSDYDEGVRSTDQSVAVLSRSSTIARMERWGGLISEAYIGRVTRDYAGFVERVAKQVFAEMNRSGQSAEGEGSGGFDFDKIEGRLGKKLAKWILKDDGRKKILRAFVNEYLVSPYSSRGMELEFEREFYLMSLHWDNSPPKQGVSLTTRPGLVWTNTGVTFADSEVGAAIYVVGVPLEKVRVAFASTYSGEYEVTVMEPEFNFFGLNRGLVLYRSQHEGPQKSREQITPAKAEDEGIDPLDINYLVFEGDIPEEVKQIMRRLRYFPNGEPENLDERPWDQNYYGEGWHGEGGYHYGEGGYPEGGYPEGGPAEVIVISPGEGGYPNYGEGAGPEGPFPVFNSGEGAAGAEGYKPIPYAADEGTPSYSPEGFHSSPNAIGSNGNEGEGN